MPVNSVIIGSVRSAVTPRGGALSHCTLQELAAPLIQQLLNSSGVSTDSVDDLIVGNALGAGGNPARLIALASGLSEHVPGLTIDRQCCSGLDAVLIADQMIRSGVANVVIAGGVESYSQRPHRFSHSKTSGQLEPFDQPPFTPWPERDPDMATAADALAKTAGISANEQNSWAMHSHKKARSAADQLEKEIVPIHGINKDSFTRVLSPSLCARATPVHGTITSANMAVAADGAAFTLLVSEAIAKEIRSHKSVVRAGVTLGANPEFPGLAPVAAVNCVLNKMSIGVNELQRIEIMEAFAAQTIACVRELDIDDAICNASGGALARGHPIGASGAILLTRLFNESQLKPGLYLAAIAAAGGLGTALLIETLE